MFAKRFIRVACAVVASLLVAVLLVIPVFAYLYRAPVTINSTSATSYTMLPLSVASPNTWMAANGFMSSTGQDTHIETLGSTLKPHMLTEDAILTVIPVATGSQTNLYLTTGNTPVAPMDIVTGYGGYVSVPDAAALESGNDFEIETTAYVIDDATVRSSDSLLPDADLAAGWTPSGGGTNFSKVNVDSDDANYVSTPESSSGQVDQYTLADPVAFIGRITNVTMYAKARSTAGGANSIKLGIGTQYNATSSTNINYGAITAVTIAYATYSASWATNPITGQDWDVGDLAELCYVLYNSATVAGDSIRCTYCYVVVTYTGGPIVDKQGAISLYQDGNNNIVVDEIRRLHSPDSFVDGGGWATETNAYDLDFTTGATVSVAATSWSTFLELPHASINCIGVRIRSNYNVAQITKVDLDAFYGGVWVDVYNGSNDASVLLYKFTVGLAVQGITSWRVSFYNTAGGAQTATLYELQYIEQTKLTNAFTEGEHLLKVTNDATNTTLYYDTAIVQTTGAATVTDNAADWRLMSTSAPYMQYYSHSVDSGAGLVLIAHYHPEAIVLNTYDLTAGTADSGTAATLVDAALVEANDYWNGARLTIVTTVDGLAPQGETAVVSNFDAATDTLQFANLSAAVDINDTYSIAFGTLPDLEAPAQDGIIVWGANPTGTTVTLGGLVSSSQPSAGVAATVVPIDVLPEVEVSDWFTEPDLPTTLRTNPLRPLVTLISDNTPLTELQTWRYYGIIFVVVVLVLTAASVNGHYLITGIATGAAIGICVQQTIFPLWALVFMIGAVVGGIIAERSPSL